MTNNMPYEIVVSNAGGKKGYRVRKQGTSKYYSKHALSKKKATAQMRVLYMNEKR